MAWTGNFKTQIEDLAGSILDTAAVEQWLLDGCHDVFRRVGDKLGPEEQLKFTGTSSSSSNNIDISGLRDIYSVTRNGVVCHLGTWLLKNKYTDADSIWYPTNLTPIYYVEGQTLYVYPSPTAAEQAEYRYSPEYTITNWDSSISSIANFPIQWYRAVMLYGAVQLLHRKMLDMINATPLINVVPPEPPPLPTLSVGEAGAVTIASLGTAPTYDNTIAAAEFGQLATLIDTEEDTELSAAKIQEINAILQNELNEYNEKSALYQSMVTQAQMNASANREDYAQTLSKYNAEISHYSAEVNTTVQEYTIKGQDYQWFSSTYARLRAEYESMLAIAPQDAGKAV